MRDAQDAVALDARSDGSLGPCRPPRRSRARNGAWATISRVPDEQRRGLGDARRADVALRRRADGVGTATAASVVGRVGEQRDAERGGGATMHGSSARRSTVASATSVARRRRASRSIERAQLLGAGSRGCTPTPADAACRSRGTSSAPHDHGHRVLGGEAVAAGERARRLAWSVVAVTSRPWAASRSIVGRDPVDERDGDDDRAAGARGDVVEDRGERGAAAADERRVGLGQVVRARRARRR